MDQGFSSSTEKLVLLVDDDKDVLDLLEVIVSKGGFKVAMAADGAEAQEKARALMPRAVWPAVMPNCWSGSSVRARGSAIMPVRLT